MHILIHQVKGTDLKSKIEPVLSKKVTEGFEKRSQSGETAK